MGARHDCPNCGAPAPGHFCAQCGQEQGDLVPTVGEWLAEAADELLSVDGRVPASLRVLLRRPGRLSAEWAIGRRVRYVRPFRLYLITAVAFFVIWPLTVPERGALAGLLEGVAWAKLGHSEAVSAGPDESPAVAGAGDEDVNTESGAARGDRVRDKVRRQLRLMTSVLPQVAMIVLVPVFAGLLWLVLHGGRTYAVHLVFALHFHAWFFLISALVLGLIVVPSKWVWPQATGWLPALAHVAAPVYLALGIGRFYEVGAVRAAVATVLVLVPYLVVFTFTVIGAIGLVPLLPFG